MNRQTQTRRTNQEHNAAVAAVATAPRSLADIEQDLQAARQGLMELESRIADLQDEALERITGHKKPGRKRHRSGFHQTVGQS